MPLAAKAFSATRVGSSSGLGREVLVLANLDQRGHSKRPAARLIVRPDRQAPHET